MTITKNILTLVSSVILIGAIPALGQPNSQQMENMLNKVDAQPNWSQTPVTNYPAGQSPYVVPANNMPSAQYVVPSNTNQLTPYINPNNANPQYLTQPGQAPGMRQQMLRSLFGGSPQSNYPSGNNTSNFSGSTAYSDWQESENQAARARDAEERARYDKNKWNRGDDASQAYYAANSARAASDRVYEASQRGDPTGKQYADRARAAADRARADADRARYYADTGD